MRTIPPHLLPGWGDWIGGKLDIVIWPGDHFFIHPNADRLAALLRSIVMVAGSDT